ncbi:MAG TPA: hypothetical protein VNL18_09200 [Gemmatimonadales bacterium]|nr:hypothetical protein [Gemmatimonadales bacterium]
MKLPPRSSGMRLAALGCCALVLAQCNSLSGIAEDLERSFTVEPGTMRPGDSLQAVLTISNPTLRSASLTGQYSCPAFLYTFRGDTEVELEGTKFDCPAAFTRFRIEALDTLRVRYRLVARVRTPGSSDPYTPAPVGTYRLKADLNMSLPDLEVVFTVEAPTASR